MYRQIDLLARGVAESLIDKTDTAAMLMILMQNISLYPRRERRDDGQPPLALPLHVGQ